jgi:hypothetical protein
MRARIIHALDPQEPVEVLGEAGDMLQVRATRWQPPIMGYVLRSAIVRPRPKLEVFPRLQLGGEITIASVPASLPLSVFQAWLASTDEAPWLPKAYADDMRSGMRPSVGKLVRGVISENRQTWDSWVEEVGMQSRASLSTIDEWVTLMQGGREMWSIRAERIFEQASQHSSALGWVVPADVVHWSGRVQLNPDEPKYRTWYEVELTKLERQLKGWYKASLLNEFVLPTPSTDLTVPENRLHAFDLQRPRLRPPDDPEIDEARKAGRGAAQYIDVRRALGWGQLHHNLCGEFCVAALASSDVVPLLGDWLPRYTPARGILSGDLGTSIPDLESMLDACQMKYEFYRAEGSVAPITPTYVRDRLDTGRMAIVFTGVTPSGAVKSHGRIRHWVVIEDILPIGSSGWLRLYNPFSNREEVYRFDDVFDLPSRASIGLWVEPKPPAAQGIPGPLLIGKAAGPPIPAGR